MIPVPDWTDNAQDPQAFSVALGQVCGDHGFFLLTNHGVPSELVDAMFAQADGFFALPDGAKAPLSIAQSPHNRGWAALGTESLDARSGLVDQKQAFSIGLDLAADDLRSRHDFTYSTETP